MSLLSGILGGAGALGSLISGGINAGITAKQNKIANAQNDRNYALAKDISERNLGLQKSQFQYQQDLQNQIFQREDNSVQRRARDMEAAGLSKTLAAGGGAGAGAIVGQTEPQQEMYQKEAYNKYDPQLQLITDNAVTTANSMIQQAQNVGITNAQRALIGAQAGKVKSDQIKADQETLNLQTENLVKKAQLDMTPTMRKKLESEIAQNYAQQRLINQNFSDTHYNSELRKSLGTTTDKKNMFGELAEMGVTTTQKAVGDTVRWIQDKYNELRGDKRPKQQIKDQRYGAPGNMGS